jgi:protein-L-isoaspartate(D-aspartate) O-methyltransferase
MRRREVTFDDALMYGTPVTLAWLSGVRDTQVLESLHQIRRTRFVGVQDREFHYVDIPIPIDCGQECPEAIQVGRQTEKLKLTGNERVLEIGTGSGFHTAILARLAREVYTVEQHPLLSLRARGVLDGFGFENIHYKIGDGSYGWEEHGPFDRIMVTASVAKVPPKLYEQLAEGGIMLIPVGKKWGQELVQIKRQDGRRKTYKGKTCHVGPLDGEFSWEQLES